MGNQQTTTPREPKGYEIYTIADIREMKLDDTNLVTPSCQRPHDPERSKEIRQYILTNYKTDTFTLGTMCINRVGNQGRIIDGSHRIRAIVSIDDDTLHDPQYEGLLNVQLLIDMRYNLSADKERMLFKTINLSIPCPFYVLDDGERSIMCRKLKAFIDGMWSGNVSLSRKCISPNINIDNILDEIDRQNILSNLYETDLIRSYEDLEAGVITLNRVIGGKLCGRDGYSMYIRYAEGAAKRHTFEKFTELILETRAKATPYRGSGPHAGKPTSVCYLGLVPYNRWVGFIHRTNIYN